MTTTKPKAQARCYTSDTVVIRGQHSLNPADEGVVWGTVLRCWHDVDPPTDLLLKESCPDLVPGQVYVYWRSDFSDAALKLVRDNSLHITGLSDRSLPDGSHGSMLSVIEDEKLAVDSRLCDTGLHVKRNVSDAMSGTIESIDTRLHIRHLVTNETRVVSSNEVFKAREWYLDAVVRCGDWIGVIDEVVDETLIMLDDGSVHTCTTLDVISSMGAALSIQNGVHSWSAATPGSRAVVEHSAGLKVSPIRDRTIAPEVPGSEREEPKWMVYDQVGSFQHCRILNLDTTEIAVTWQYHRMTSDHYVSQRPPQWIRKPKPGQTGPNLQNVQVFQTISDGSSYDLGESVAFKDVRWQEWSEMVESCRNRDIDPASLVQEWRVERVQQEAVVRWQDDTQSRHAATDLVKYDYVDDLDLWPADPVEHKQTGKVGIVQKVSPVDRVAHVRWYTSDNQLAEVADELSLYDLLPMTNLEIDDRDYVLIMDDGEQRPSPGLAPPAHSAQSGSRLAHHIRSAGGMLASFVTGQGRFSPRPGVLDNSSVDWFGQVARLELDGTALVSLGLASPARTMRIDTSRLVRVAIELEGVPNDDMDIDLDSQSGSYISVEQEGDLVDAQELPWLDEQGQNVSEAGSDWEDADDGGGGGTPADSAIAIETPEPASVSVAAVSAPPPPRHDRSTEVHPAARPVQIQSSSMPSDDNHFAPFEVLDTDPVDHYYHEERPPTESAGNLKRIQKEYGILRNSLPPGILVRTFENRLDLIRVLIVGPPGTPYEYAPMVFDVHLPHNFGRRPPNVYFHSWTNGIGRVNPNLYEDGKVCLSLLGTWEGNEQTEIWTPKSTLLQVFVSIQSLILVREPYYNEAGFEVLSASDDNAVASRNYSERAYILTRDFVAHALEEPPAGLEHELRWLYLGPPALLSRVIGRATQAMQRTEEEVSSGAVNGAKANNGKSKVDEDEYKIAASRGAKLLLSRTIAKLHTIAAVNAPHPPAA